jgi:hypothetical protein
MTTELSRRRVLSLIAVGAAGARLGRPTWARADERPWLATPEQVEAETRLLALLEDPEIQRIQQAMRTELAAWPRGQTPDGKARIDEAVAQWTNTLLFSELAAYRPRPALLWGTDDTPREWLGHRLGGVGTSGDNPDAIYRLGLVDGAATYEMVGRFDMARRPAQLVIEFDRGDLTKPAEMMKPNPTHPDLGVQIALLTDRDLDVASDGTFRLTLGPGPGKGDGRHITTEPGPVTIGLRDMLSDWNQRPAQVTIHRLDGDKPQPFDPEELRRRARADLPDYIHFWAKFPDRWMGGLKPNTYAPPAARAGGWGAVSGLRFTLRGGEALIVKTRQGGAAYTGFQLVDPWMIAPDAKRHQCCLNLSQARPGSDGSITYVISPSDPGVANWLDTAGLHDGFGIARWQALPAAAATGELLAEFRVASLADVAELDLPRVTPQERRKQLADRAWSYASRTR